MTDAVLTRRFTIDEIAKMVDIGVLGEDEPLELIDGELVEVSPQGPIHSTLVASLAQKIVLAIGTSSHVRTHSPVCASDVSLPEPDISVIRGEASLKAYAAHPKGEDVVLAIEVAVTSLNLDQRKVAIYAEAGIGVYWILDVTGERLLVHEELNEGRYDVTTILSPNRSVSVPGVDLTLQVADMLR